MEETNVNQCKTNFTSTEEKQHKEKKFMRSLNYITQKRDVCERFFETLLTDLKNCITEYTNGYIDSSSFADEVQFLGESMKDLCEDGEIRMILDRAQLVMLSKLTEDITERDNKENTNKE